MVERLPSEKRDLLAERRGKGPLGLVVGEGPFPGFLEFFSLALL